MVSADKYHNLLKYGPGSAIAISLSLAGFIYWQYQSSNISQQAGNTATDVSEFRPVAVTAQDWDNAVKPSSQSAQQSPDDKTMTKPEPSRFRLAGTFFALDEAGTNELRKAILDDLTASNQMIVAEGQSVADITVRSILKDHIIIARGSQTEELWLLFNQPQQTAIKTEIASQKTDSDTGGTNTASRFGEKLIGKNRWIFDRKLVLDYYSELRDNPDRLVAVFDSLKPIYSDGNNITGYRLGIEGESEFFKAVGFKEGDVVRSVNSLPMTNRRRAEYFIGEFVKDRANAFVIEVERDGRKDKLIYQVR